MDIVDMLDVEHDVNNIDDPECSETLKQIEISHNAIAELIEECNEMVTNIKIANDLREINRRKEEKRSEEARTSFLEEEAVKAQQQFDEIYSKWDPISKYNDSIDIHNACEDQKKKCEELLNCKNNVIEALKSDLAKADNRFVEDQVTQRNDVNILSYRIDKQIEILRDAYRRHLKLIEDSVIQERYKLIDRCQAEWEVLDKKYEQEEVQDIEDRNRMVEEFERQIDLMHSEHFEKFNETEEKLDKELLDLQINVEKLEGSCVLDEKKLEYNYIVLTKRQKELVKIKSDQKQKINRLRDTEIKLRTKIENFEKSHQIQSDKLKREISEMKSDYERNTEKMQRLSDVNENTFKKIWQLNVKRAMTLVKKIFQIDRRLHEEILRVEWKMPEFKLIHMNDLPSIKLAIQSSDATERDEPIDESSEKHVLPKIPSDGHLTKFILQEIMKNVEFLSGQTDELTQNLSDSRKSVVNYDFILKILKIDTEARMESLKNHLAPYVECLTCKKNRQKDQNIFLKYQETMMKNQRTGSGYKTRRKSTQASLRYSSAPQSSREPKFVEEQIPSVCMNAEHIRRIDQLTLLNAISNFVAEANKQEKTVKKNTTLDKLRVSRILTEKDIELYWDKFNDNAFKEKEFQWRILQQCLNAYLIVAQDQNSLRKEVENLEKQNQELEYLLSGYDKAKTE